MDPISNYKLQCQAAEAMVQSYYNNVPPFTGQPACIPTVPVDTEGNPLVSADEVPFRYIELALSDGTTFLAILTPYEVANGPGVEYRVRPERL
jgi:hypothetical protein